MREREREREIHKQNRSVLRPENTPTHPMPLCHQGISQRVTTAKSKAIAYLKQQLPHLTDDYILAMTTYALTLAGDSAAASAFTRLLGNAVVKGLSRGRWGGRRS